MPNQTIQQAMGMWGVEYAKPNAEAAVAKHGVGGEGDTHWVLQQGKAVQKGDACQYFNATRKIHWSPEEPVLNIKMKIMLGGRG